MAKLSTDPSAADRRSEGVRRVYGIGAARWYDAFRRWWTRATARAAEEELDRILAGLGGDDCRVLDMGCGTGYNLGRLLALRLPFRSYRGTDFSAEMLDLAREQHRQERRAIFELLDLRQLAEEQERYDIVFCTWVASHLERPRDAFEIAYGVLAQGGHALCLTMTRPRWYIFWWLTPFTRLFRADYVNADALEGLPGLVTKRHWTSGLTTLVHLAKYTGPVARHDDRKTVPRRDLPSEHEVSS